MTKKCIGIFDGLDVIAHYIHTFCSGDLSIRASGLIILNPRLVPKDFVVTEYQLNNSVKGLPRPTIVFHVVTESSI
jgi:hypothetical protein